MNALDSSRLDPVRYDDNPSSSLSDAYWNTDTSGITNLSQGAGNIANHPGITGLTTAQFQSGLRSGLDPSVPGSLFPKKSGSPFRRVGNIRRGGLGPCLTNFQIHPLIPARRNPVPAVTMKSPDSQGGWVAPPIARLPDDCPDGGRGGWRDR